MLEKGCKMSGGSVKTCIEIEAVEKDVVSGMEYRLFTIRFVSHTLSGRNLLV